MQYINKAEAEAEAKAEAEAEAEAEGVGVGAVVGAGVGRQHCIDDETHTRARLGIRWKDENMSRQCNVNRESTATSTFSESLTCQVQLGAAKPGAHEK